MTEGTPDVVAEARRPTFFGGLAASLGNVLLGAVPHAERVGETRIAFDAAALRKAALTRIEELTRTSVV